MSFEVPKSIPMATTITPESGPFISHFQASKSPQLDFNTNTKGTIQFNSLETVSISTHILKKQLLQFSYLFSVDKLY